MTDLYCSMIHSGLELNFKSTGVTAQHCCLRHNRFPVDIKTDFWHHVKFTPLREQNKQNVWDSGCENCRLLEKAGQQSFRTGMNQGLTGKDYNTAGPKRIDLMFDISCNLACRTCGPWSSTFWSKHLKENSVAIEPVRYPHSTATVISALEKLDLSNLEMFVFCGGETLMAQSYWEIVAWLVNNTNSKQVTLCFQTNGTQAINPRNHDLIDQFHLVKLHVSLDGVGQRFEYLRWPADWNQVINNLMELKATAPSNVMFLVEETVSIFNLHYQSELDAWTKANFNSNREGDIINHTKHLARGMFSLDNLTQEYVDAMQTSDYRNLVPKIWKENTAGIISMLEEIRRIDGFRNQSFEQTFPEAAEFYRRYL